MIRRKQSQTRHYRSRTSRPRIESLEDRRMLATLTNGPGEATLDVLVDGYGSFGSSVETSEGTANLNYHPVGEAAPGSSVFESGVAVGFRGGTREFLTEDMIGASGGLLMVRTTGDATEVVSNFLYNALDFTLTQSVAPVYDTGGQMTGTSLNQMYEITNTSASDVSFDMVRYVDGDLSFFGSGISDGGGILQQDDQLVLFQTATATGIAEDTTFLGVSATGGTTEVGNGYEMRAYSGLRDDIIAGLPLTDTMQGTDDNADNVIDLDAAYDVTLAIRQAYLLGPNESAVFSTVTAMGEYPFSDTPPPPQAPEVLSITINGDQIDPPDLPQGPQPTSWALQRSDLRSLVIEFSEPRLNLTASDFVMTNLGFDPMSDPQQQIQLSDDQITMVDNVATIAFGADELPPGIYELQILDTITSQSGVMLDGDGDGVAGGNHVMRGNQENHFYRIQGEFNRDGGVSIFDFPSYAYWFGESSVEMLGGTAPSYMDMNRDGGVTVFDLPIFADNFERAVFLPPVARPNQVAEAPQEESQLLALIDDDIVRDVMNEWNRNSLKKEQANL